MPNGFSLSVPKPPSEFASLNVSVAVRSWTRAYGEAFDALNSVLNFVNESGTSFVVHHAVFKPDFISVHIKVSAEALPVEENRHIL